MSDLVTFEPLVSPLLTGFYRVIEERNVDLECEELEEEHIRDTELLESEYVSHCCISATCSHISQDTVAHHNHWNIDHIHCLFCDCSFPVSSHW